MKKSALLCIVNLVLLLWFSFLLVKGNYPPVSLSTLTFYDFMKLYSSFLMIFLFTLINASCIYILFIKQPKKISYPVVILLTFAPLVWFVFAFLGFFFASHVFLPVIGIALALGSFFYCKRFSKKIALFISLGTVIVLGIVLLSSFEEDYCWRQGEKVDPSGTKYVAATKDDAKQLAGYGVTRGQEIGIAFRTHMLCHQTFHPLQAFEKSYLHL